MVATLHAQLRSATREAHLELERHLALLSGDLSIVRYTRIIALFYGFYRPMESALRRLKVLAPHQNFPLRERTELLKRDLLALGYALQATSELPTCIDLPDLYAAEHFAGCLYVLEGASLGGQVITRHLRERLELTDHGGTAFFTGDGAATAARWKCVLEWLEHVGHSDLCMEQIITSACETFRAFVNWARVREIHYEH